MTLADTENFMTPTTLETEKDGADSSAPICSASTHDFKEEYYGWRCSKCGCFYPNTAPLGAWLNGETYDGQDQDS